MNPQELKQLAEDCIRYEQENPDCDDGIRKRLDYLADSANPATILQMIALIEMMGEALEECVNAVYPYEVAKDAIAKYRAMTK